MHAQANPSSQATQHFPGQALRPGFSTGQPGYSSQDAFSQAGTQTQPMHKQPIRQSADISQQAHGISHGMAYPLPGHAPAQPGEDARGKTAADERVRGQGLREAAAKAEPAKGWTALQDLKLVKKGEHANLTGWLRSKPIDCPQGRMELTKVLLFASKEAVQDDCKVIIMLNDPAKTRWAA